MDKLKIAIATNDGKTYNKNHFGDSNVYNIYELSDSSIDIICKQENNTLVIDEYLHGAHEKAKGVARMLKELGVQVNIAKIFGPNIKRIRKKFVCILMNDELIEDSLIKLQKEFKKIFKEWELGEKRDVLDFRIKKG